MGETPRFPCTPAGSVARSRRRLGRVLLGIAAVMLAVAVASFVADRTGAGLLGASWRGLALALESLLDASPLTLGLFAAGVLSLNVLFFRLLRRGRSTADAVTERAGDSSERR